MTTHIRKFALVASILSACGTEKPANVEAEADGVLSGDSHSAETQAGDAADPPPDGAQGDPEALTAGAPIGAPTYENPYDRLVFEFDDCAARDASGWKHQGVPSGVECIDGAPIEARGGSAAYFDGSAAIRIEDSAGLYVSGEATLMAWVRRDGPEGGAILGDFVEHGLALSPGDGGLVYTTTHAGVTADFAADGGVVGEGPWVHVGVVRRADQVTFYIDGEPVASAPLVGVPAEASEHFAIGARPDGSQPFQGALDRVVFVARAYEPWEMIAVGMPRTVQVLRAFTCDPDAVADGTPLLEGIDGTDTQLVLSSTTSPCNYEVGLVGAQQRVLSTEPGGYLMAASAPGAICLTQVIHTPRPVGAAQTDESVADIDEVRIECTVAGADGTYGPLQPLVVPDGAWAAWLGAVEPQPGGGFRAIWTRDSTFQFLNINDNGRNVSDGIFETAFGAGPDGIIAGAVSRMSEPGRIVVEDQEPMVAWDGHFCGDGQCDADEDCETCEADCPCTP